MAENYNEIAAKILKACGGPRNIKNVSNCMTRLRLNVIDKFAVNEDELKSIQGVLQVIKDGDILQIVLGPGRVVKVTAEFNALISAGTVELDIAKREQEKNEYDNIAKMSSDNDWKVNKALIKAKQKRFAWLSKGMRHLANIFSPLIPGIIAAGLFAAIASIILQSCGVTDWKLIPNNGVKVMYQICKALSDGFTTYLVIFVGVNAAKEYGASPMLGGFIGGICAIGNITEIAKLIGLYNLDKPLDSILMSGKGGVIGVIIGVYLLSLLEKHLHKHIPNALDTVLTPFLCILLVGVVYVFGIMIATGYISYGICWIIGKLTMNEHVIVRIICGFVSAAMFLPLVLTGMHHGLVAFYAEELALHHYVSLYPALAMAGAGQVGAAIALYIKCKKTNNTKLQQNITSSIIPGVLGVGEPLIYSVTLPLFRPFITAGLGAGIGGAFVMAFRVGSTAWGPSGFVAIPLMNWMNGKPNAAGMGIYTASLIISIVAGFLFTWFMIPQKTVMPKELDPREIAFKK